MTNIFASSWTTWVGIVIEALTFFERYLADNPIPQEPKEWTRFILQIVIGIGLIASKDWNKTNAVHANPTPQTAPALAGTTMVEPITTKGD